MEHVCVVPLSQYFTVSCNPSRAVTLPNIGVPQYIGVPLRVTYPYGTAPARICEGGFEGWGPEGHVGCGGGRGWGGGGNGSKGSGGAAASAGE